MYRDEDIEVKTLDVLRGARWFAGKAREVLAARTAVTVGGLRLVDVEYADGGSERYLLDDEVSWAGLVASPPAPLELRAAPALPRIGAGARETIPATDQSNTLVALDERVLVKAYRRLAPGVHPEVEVCAALAGTDAPVPAFLGSIHHEDTTLALLQAFVPEAEAGWEAPIARLAAGDRGTADYAAAGRTAAALHRALRAALGPGARRPAAWRDAVAEAAMLEPAVAGAGSRLAVLDAAMESQRIHGDLHYAQFLRAPGRLLVVDFEGDPTRPLAERREPGSPLYDVACLLRSIDHIGSAAARRSAFDPEPWSAEARAAALAAYEAEAGAPVDGEALHAFEVLKDCQTLVYAHRVLPEWAYAPRAGLERLLRA